MADPLETLPEGFVIDEPDQDAPAPPPGFELDPIEGTATPGYERTGVEKFLDYTYEGQEKLMPGMSAVPRFAEGMYRGLQNFKTGVQQLGNFLDIYADDEEREAQSIKLKSELARNDMRTMDLGLPAQGGSMVGEALPSMALPGGTGGTLTRKIAGGVAADTLASVADPVREGETRAGNLKTAATFSAGFRGTGGFLSGAWRRLANARAGNLQTEEMRALVDAADAEEIRLFFQDVSEGAMARKAAVAAETVFGVGSRRAQNDEAYAAASRWLADVSGDGDDYAEIVNDSLRNKLDIFRRQASNMYGRVSDKLGEAAGDVPTTSFVNASNAAIAAERAKGTRANAQVIDFLERYRDAPHGNFDEMIEFRSDMRKDLENLIRGDGINYSAETAIRNAYSAIDQDMESFARLHEADDLWRKANDFYAEHVVQYKKGKLKALLNESSAANFDRQAAWRYLTQASSNNAERARLMWRALDSKGRNAVRMGLLDEALEAATPANGPFSPAKYAAYLEKRMPVIEQFFRGGKREELKGLINVMRAVERSGQILENPPTGNRVIPWLLGAGTVIEPTAAAVGGTSLGGMKLMFETKTGRNFLLAAADASPGSEDFDKILEGIETFASRASN